MKRITLSLLVVLLVFSLSNTNAFAMTVEETPVVEQTSVVEQKPGEDINHDITPYGYWEYWEVDSSTKQSGLYYGSKIFGTSGWGPQTIEYTKSYGFNFNISSTLSAQLEVGENAIEGALDCSFGVTWEDASGSSFDVPNGEQWAIYYRPVYEKYNVVIRKWIHMDGQEIRTTETESGVVSKFVGWDFIPTRLN